MEKYLILFSLLVLAAVGAWSLAGSSAEAPHRLPPLQEPPAAEAAAADTASAAMPEFIRSPSHLGEVEFPHLFHYDDLGIACADCHHETDATVLNVPHEDYFDDFYIDCTTCHHPSGEVTQEPQACSSCHPASPRTIADETLSAKVVIHQNCWECHDAGTGAEAFTNCKACHTGPQLTY